MLEILTTSPKARRLCWTWQFFFVKSRFFSKGVWYCGRWWMCWIYWDELAAVIWLLYPNKSSWSPFFFPILRAFSSPDKCPHWIRISLSAAGFAVTALKTLRPVNESRTSCPSDVTEIHYVYVETSWQSRKRKRKKRWTTSFVFVRSWVKWRK